MRNEDMANEKQAPSEHPAIYHITHMANLRAIVESGGLVSDATMIARGGPAAGIGMSSIKQRRQCLRVKCHPGRRVGEFVPFYFCPRSVMLFVIHCANNEDLRYRGGQEPIVHLEAHLRVVVAWAKRQGRPWAFSLSNAGTAYAEFRSNLNHLGHLNWNAIRSTDFRNPSVKEGKQAEFLVHDNFPWTLVARIGVLSKAVASHVQKAIRDAVHQPSIHVKPSWYF